MLVRGFGPVGLADQVPALFAPSEAAARRTLEFFAVTIRNMNTRKAYAHAVSKFSAWCEARGITDVRQVQPLHVAAYIEQLELAAPSVKQRLAAIRMLFDWLVVGQVLPMNPASSVRGPRHSVKKGKTPVLAAEEARAMLDAIDVSTPIGLRDRALIGLMVYTFARVGATIQMRAEDVFVQGRRLWVRLHEKGGKEHEMPCHHNLEAWLEAYVQAAGLQGKAWLFVSARGRSGVLGDQPMRQADVFRMVQRRAEAAGVRTRIGCHSFRKSPSAWLTTKAPGPLGCTTGAAMRSAWMRSSGSCCSTQENVTEMRTRRTARRKTSSTASVMGSMVIGAPWL
jgi:site-specific recombinase XerD